ncbi:MAG: hypothetical protein ACW99F_15040 [Candidatus Hodarchaeales archaeon]|jgi:predicted transcriptional regulator
MKSKEKENIAIFSVKPKYVALIFNGSKRVELRKTNPRSISNGSRVFFWETSPAKRLAGTALVDFWIREPLESLWGLISDIAGISKNEFDEYFKGLRSGVALYLKEAEEFEQKPELSILRKKLGFRPPQSFRYASQSELSYLENNNII